MKRLFPLLILAIALLPIVAAGSFSTSMKEVKQNIYLNETAIFELRIDNNLGYAEEIDIDIGNDPQWISSAKPTIALTSEYGITVPDDDERYVTLYFTPKARLESAWYVLEVKARGRESDQVITERVSIYVRQTGIIAGSYLPSYSVSLELPEKIDPREDLTVKVVLENRNQLNITDMYVKVTSDLFTRDFTTDLPPMRRKTESFTIDLDDLLEPDKIIIEAEATVEKDGRSFTAHSDSEEVEIAEYSVLKRSGHIDKAFLKSKEYITLTNDGNVVNTGEVRLRSSFFKNLFTRATPSATLLEDGGEKYLVWDFTLSPRERADITISQNYRPLVVILVLIIILTAAYFLFRSPVIVNKEASRIIRKGKDPNFTELKILLHVRNRSAKTISSITIIDRIPRIAEVEKDFQIGTIAPTKITKHDKRGTSVYWDLQALDPYEERIITYRIRSRLTIVGGITLPAATIKFNVGRREMLIHSGRTNVQI